MAELFHGLVATSQNRWPSLRFDAMGVNQLVAPVLAAGFYYKTFMWPAAFWEKLYEPLIRRAAGLGRASGLHDPDHYDKATLHCDVLVIGAGPAGLMAALAAARGGARVVLCEEDARLGGRLLSERRTIDGRPALDWVAAAEAELRAAPDCRILDRTSVFGVFDGEYGAVERVSDHLASPPPTRPASGSGASWRSAMCWPQARSSDRSCSATTTGRASCWPAPCGPTSTASASRRAAARSCSRTTTTRPGPCRISRPRASRSRPSSMPAPTCRPGSGPLPTPQGRRS